MDAARADLEKLAAKRAETTKRVAVGVEAQRTGVLELAVTYTVANAGWGPVWDARLDPAASKGCEELSGTRTTSRWFT